MALANPAVAPNTSGSEAAYRLLRSLGGGSYGTAYLAADPRTARPVELRHLSTRLSDGQRDALDVRLRLCDLVLHPVARTVRRDNTLTAAGSLVVDYQGDETLPAWLVSASPSASEILSVLGDLAECLNQAHRAGVTHGDLGPSVIGIDNGQPRLDFTGFTKPLVDNHAPLPGSVEAKANDVRGLALVVAAVLEVQDFEDACRGISRRGAARLRQLARVQQDTTHETPDVRLFVRVLESLLRKSGTGETPVDTTAELRKPDASDATAETDVNASPVLRPLSARRDPAVGDTLGRYRLESKLGEGGMGCVYKATDLGTQQTVAIKVLGQNAMLRRNAVRRFAKEARLLASVNNPNITNLLDVSDEDGIHYIALEFVDGVDLKRTLAIEGTLSERIALAIAADVARALVDAHRREIVHRDIKPENILLVDHRAGQRLGDTPPRAKLTDFGIARHIDQSESLAVTQAGSLLGTPMYMSPEQCRGCGEVMPQSDIYSLGVTLFELLSGAPPFDADDPLALAGKHCFDAPPSLLKLNPSLTEPVAELVAKCLAKNPADRYADAGQVLKAITRLLRGEAADAGLRPVMPPHDASRVVSNTMTWQLPCSAALLWPYVSNTERLNRAIGLPPVEYRIEYPETGGTRRFGTIRLAGIAMSWEEHPFEWVEGRRMSVLREFPTGPLEWFTSTVELRPLPGDETELVHTVRILPRGTMGKLIAHVETGAKCRRSLDKVYRRIGEQLIRQGNAPTPTKDAFEAAPKLKAEQRTRIRQRSETLLNSGADRDAAEKLTQWLLEAPPQEVAKLRPLALADRLGVDEQRMLDTCLRAAVYGLLRLEWDVLCPTCRVTADTRDTLKQLTSHTHCEACNVDFKSDVANAVELVFRAAADIRDTEVGQYCVGGPWHAPHVVAQLRLEPGECLDVELALSPGDFTLRGPRLSQNIGLRVQQQGAPSQLVVPLGEGSSVARICNLRAGGQVLTLENAFDYQQLVRIERTIPRDDVVTAARAAATPSFRELFPGEILESGRLVAAEHVTLLAAGLADVDQLYESLDDAEAFSKVEKHVDLVREVCLAFGGEVVKILGEIVLAVFDNPLSAVETAFALQRDTKAATDSATSMAIAVHAGPALVTTANDRLDYFGATARQATALPAAGGAGVSLAESVYADAAVADWLAQRGVPGRVTTVALPGKPSQIIQHFASQPESTRHGS